MNLPRVSLLFPEHDKFDYAKVKKALSKSAISIPWESSSLIDSRSFRKLSVTGCQP